jgi:hypothetical protein
VRRTFATLAAGASLLAACAGTPDDDVLSAEPEETAEPEPTETEDPDEAEPEPEETEEPEPEDPYAVPDEIDETYVEDVMNAILQVQAEVLRGSLELDEGSSLPAELMALHFSTTEGEQRTFGLEEYQGYVDDPATRGGLVDPVPDEAQGTFTVEYLHHVEPERCVLAVGYWDRTAISAEAPSSEDSMTAISLSRIGDSDEVSEGNPTPWQWRDNRGIDGSMDPAEWSELPWDSALDHSCTTLGSANGDDDS